MVDEANSSSRTGADKSPAIQHMQQEVLTPSTEKQPSTSERDYKLELDSQFQAVRASKKTEVNADYDKRERVLAEKMSYDPKPIVTIDPRSGKPVDIHGKAVDAGSVKRGDVYVAPRVQDANDTKNQIEQGIRDIKGKKLSASVVNIHTGQARGMGAAEQRDSMGRDSRGIRISAGTGDAYGNNESFGDAIKRKNSVKKNSKIGVSPINGIQKKQLAIQQKVGAKAIRNRLRTAGSVSMSDLLENAKNTAVRGGMLLFWLVAGIAVAKDIIDVFTVLLDLVGDGLSATVVGAVVGVPILVFSELLDKAAGLLVDFVIGSYFGYIGGGFALRLVIMSIGAIIDLIPGVDLLPLTTVSFFAAYLLGKGVQKATQLAEGKVGKTASTAARTGKRVLKYIGT